jgi:hypothetical protein
LTTTLINLVTGITLIYSIQFAYRCGVSEESYDESAGVSRGKYLLGVFLTLGASGTYTLNLSLMQLMFENVIKKHTFSAVLNMQIYTTLVATFASVINLFASGEWKPLKHETDMFQSGQFSYLMTLVWSSLSWQVIFSWNGGLFNILCYQIPNHIHHTPKSSINPVTKPNPK